jgi:hypothetical protein
MKFFIASPWRNKDAVMSLSNALTARNHTAYSFLDNGANLVTGTSVTEKSEESLPNPVANWQDNPAIEEIFESEMQALKESDAVILLEPSGRSSLAEAGIAYGMGKKVVLVGLVEHPEVVVYCICGSRYRTSRRSWATLTALPHRTEDAT